MPLGELGSKGAAGRFALIIGGVVADDGIYDVDARLEPGRQPVPAARPDAPPQPQLGCNRNGRHAAGTALTLFLDLTFFGRVTF